MRMIMKLYLLLVTIVTYVFVSRFYIRHMKKGPLDRVKEVSELPNTETYRKNVYETLYRPIKNPSAINCSELIANNNRTAILEAQRIMGDPKYHHINLEPSFYLQKSLTCEKFRKSRGYITHPLSNVESQFPLAYGILAYRDVEQFERLLRAIYRPQNVYCLHLDAKTNNRDKEAFEKIVGCFDNVHLSGISVDVQWGEFSLLHAELVCMKLLWQFKKWKYYINLTGQEFPLKTNRDIVSILKAVDGANIVEGTWIRGRLHESHRWSEISVPPPHNITLVKGSVHVAANRNFVDFVVNDQRAKDFLKWLRLTKVPDETFFASLNHNPHLGIKGSFLGDSEEYPLKPFFMRYVVWYPYATGFVRNCSGKYVREVCVLGVGDLYRAYNDIGLFANKFHLDFEPLALDCLEELLHEKTWKQYVDDIDTDTAYYSHLDYARFNLKH